MTYYVLPFIPVLCNVYKTLEEDYGVSLDTIHNFAKDKTNRTLVSFGQLLTKKKNYKLSNKYIKSIEKSIFDKYYMRYLNDYCKLYIDSGGYQCGQGYINKEDIPKFCDLYKEFLTSNNDKIAYAFTLDIPPNNVVFNSWKEVESYNKITYESLAELPIDVLEKIIFVFHFRSANIWPIWNRIAEQYADKYTSNYWSVGGIAGFTVNNVLPCWLYSIPLSYFLHIMKDKDNLKFHILGDFSWTTIFFSRLVTKLIKLIYNKHITITYDATSIITGNLRYRYLWKFDSSTGFVDKILLKREFKNLMYKSKSYLDHALEALNNIADKYNLPELEVSDLDKEGTSSLHPQVSAYFVIQTIDAYYSIEQYCDNISDEIVKLYADNNIVEFNTAIMETLQKLHNGKLSHKLMQKRGYGYNTIKTINNLVMAQEYIKVMQDEFRFVNQPLTWE